jgi:hypothetical protein
MSALADAALGYAANLSWALFPLAPWRNASPLIEAWPEQATSDLNVLARW